MSKGLGIAQRKIIEAGRARKVLFDCVKSVVVKSGTKPNFSKTDPDFLDACTHYYDVSFDYIKDIETWEVEHVKETCWIQDRARSPQQLFDKMNLEWDCLPQATPAMADALWTADDIYCRLYPDLYAVEHELEWKFVDVPNSCFGDMRRKLPDEIRKGKAVAKATVNRAITSMVKRQLIAPVWYSGLESHDMRYGADDWKKVARRRRWQKRPHGTCLGWLVVDGQAVAS